MQFSELDLATPLLNAVKKSGYETATPIQAQAIPIILSGADLIGCAQTGTGKTAAFTLPMLDRMLNSPRGRAPQGKPRALVLSPTRELAAQIGVSLDKYGKQTKLRQTVVYGGVSQFHQVKALRRGVETLVATPGRLLDLMSQKHIDLSEVEFLVFDEADQMLDMGFLPDLKRIVAAVPSERQTLMFSATMPKEIRKLAQQWLHEPESVETARVSATADRIAQSVHLVDKKKKIGLLTHFLGSTPRGRTLVFSRTKHGADKIVKQLKRDGVHAAAIHGNKTQGARTRAIEQFKGKNPPVLIATDIAARGLDISGVSHVVNFDLPETPETYVHRIGRTGRAGAEGVAISFCAGDERGLLHQIERLTKQRLKVEPTVAGFQPTDPIVAIAPAGGKRGRRPGGPRGGAGKGGGPKAGAKPGSRRKKRPHGAKAQGAKSHGSKSHGAKASGGKSQGAKPQGAAQGTKPQGGAKPKRKPAAAKRRKAL
ncbi:ATP-dependent RNA helicase RhlE [Planctomycetes bacterium MalM25]|nr:ATP-dependent RNA helicase RhlE [Planctomycetes bacterium MalM25]